MVTPLHGFVGAPSTTAVNYNFPTTTVATWNAGSTARMQVVGIAGTISGLSVYHGAPGTGTSYTWTLVVNGSATALSLTVSDSAVSGTSGASVPVSAGDTLTFSCTPTGTPASSGNVAWTCLFTSSSSASPVMGGQNGSLSTSAASYMSLQDLTQGASASATESDIYGVVPTSGTFSNLYVLSGAAPGTSKSYDYTLVKNGAATALTAQMAGSSTTATDTTHPVSFSPGDTVSLMAVPTGTPTAGVPKFCVQWTPAVDGESILLFGSVAAPSTSTSQYEIPQGRGATAWNAGEASRSLRTQACVRRSQYVMLSVAPGTGKSYTFTARKNLATTTLSCAVADTATTASNTAVSVSYSVGDQLSLQCAPAGTPAATAVKAGVVLYVAPLVTLNPVSLLTLGVG